ncbi:MAG: Eco57I restriction-modification methylase domain-containing protein, partial [Deltaproteobacteria bacterium]|nr:Eco57I restriction-modification methylase domain-containing protein [Deltaproteobacteria bacterium]
MNSSERLQNIIDEFDLDKWTAFFRAKSPHFAPDSEILSGYADDLFEEFKQIGYIDYKKDVNRIIIVTAKINKELSERSCRQKQYDKAKKILKEQGAYDAGIFIFYDDYGNFRFSLVHEYHLGTKRTFSYFKRFTYYVCKGFTNKTFLKQVGEASFDNLAAIKEAFSLAAVTNEFYKEFFPKYEEVMHSIKVRSGSKPGDDVLRNFALLFAIRIIFIGFIQKRKWIGEDDKFLQNLWKEYKVKYYKKDEFYSRWLKPLLFEALVNPPGRKVSYRNNEFSKATDLALQMAPYLNGGLFIEKRGYDDKGLYIPDTAIEDFMEFLFSYNFTIEENSVDDEDLQLNPEFLGIIFERLVNKKDGAVYTPRIEVDLMCRLSLVKWIDKNNRTKIPYRDVYELFFREGGSEATKDEQRHGSFSNDQYKDVINLLENITICDPAVGSGAFPVGMLHVIDEIEQHIRNKLRDPEFELTDFERKKRIISNSLYGVEVKEWAVWICQLRLWITLFIDAPDEMKLSQEAILPSLDFKIRCGDSLIQRIGNKLFPIQSHAQISSSLKGKITKLRNLKTDYFHNRLNRLPRDIVAERIKHEETGLFREIIREEIKAKRERIDRLAGRKTDEQLTWLEKASKAPVQNDLNLNAMMMEGIREEIRELEEERDAVKKDEQPLVWNIEFAEIFADKGGFDVVIGNPPYVRQEDISDPNGKIKDKKDYKGLLQEMVTIDFPEYFLNRKRNKLIQKIDAKSDLYTYFYIRSLRLLNGKGLLTFICSNSWLDVGYGIWLQKFLLTNAPVNFIIDNHSKRSFESADVNTIISVINAPSGNVNKDHLVKFIAFKKPFDDVIFTENMLAIEEAKTVATQDALRIYPITNAHLIEAGTEYEEGESRAVGVGTYVGDKWGGKYLRAPNFFINMLSEHINKFVKLKKIADVIPGCYSGINDFFYISSARASELLLEKEYLTPLIRSSGSISQ